MAEISDSKWITRAALIGVAFVVVVLIVASIFRKPTRAVAKTNCISNVKQLALGAIMYAGDNDDILPNGAVWMDKITEYVKYDSVFHDTTFVPDGGYGYAYRKKLSGVNETKIDKPQNLILLFDSTLLGRNESSELWSLPNPGRHGEGNNAAFVDGHAKWLKAPDQVFADDAKVVIEK